MNFLQFPNESTIPPYAQQPLDICSAWHHFPLVILLTRLSTRYPLVASSWYPLDFESISTSYPLNLVPSRYRRYLLDLASRLLGNRLQTLHLLIWLPSALLRFDPGHSLVEHPCQRDHESKISLSARKIFLKFTNLLMMNAIHWIVKDKRRLFENLDFKINFLPRVLRIEMVCVRSNLWPTNRRLPH